MVDPASSDNQSRMRKKTKKKQDSEDAYAQTGETVATASGGETANGGGPNTAQFPVPPYSTEQDFLNKDGTLRKKRGRPFKSNEESSLDAATAGDSTAFAPRNREKRGRSKGGSKTAQGEQQYVSSSTTTTDEDMVPTTAARQANQKAQQESIRQQQALAQAQSKAFFATMSSPDARQFIQAASATNQKSISPTIIQQVGPSALSTINANSTATGTNRATVPSPQQAAAVLARFPELSKQQQNQNLKNLAHAKGGQNMHQHQHHGKTAVTTQSNQHPQQGTVAPHHGPAGSTPPGVSLSHNNHTMSPRTMEVLLRGRTSPSEDMAMSSLPHIAGAGVLAGSTMTGPAAGIMSTYICSNEPSETRGLSGKTAGSAMTSMGRPQPSKKNTKSKKGSGPKRKGYMSTTSAEMTMVGGVMQPQRNHVKITVPDEEPSRISNPLLGLPPLPESNGHRLGSAGMAGSSPTAAAGSPNNPEAPLAPLIQGTELQAWLSLVFCRPNTYPIAQYARMLGFNIPDVEDAKDTEAWISPNATATFPFEFVKDGAIHEIPPEGQFATAIWKAAYQNAQKDSGSINNSNVDDAAILEGDIDPLYQSFLEKSEEWTTNPNNGNTSSSSSPFKNLLYHHTAKLRSRIPSPRRIQQVLNQTHDYGLVEKDQWSIFHIMKSNTTMTSTTAAADITTAPMHNGNLNSGDGAATNSKGTTNLESGPSVAVAPVSAPVPAVGLSVLETLNRSSTETAPSAPTNATADVQTSAETTSTPALSIAVPTGPSVVSELRPSVSSKENLWGFAAWHKGKDKDAPDLSMVLQYQFQWYNLVSESSNGAKVSELVMRIPYGPVPIKQGDVNITVPPGNEQDYFAEEFAQSTDTKALPMRQRLIVILYALVFEHARKCDTWYCLLQVPPSLVPLLQKYFRVTLVPSKVDKGKNVENASPHSLKRTPLVQVLCDLQKCSMKYALLLQREFLSCVTPEPTKPVPPGAPAVVKERLLVRLPTTREVKAALATPAAAQPQQQQPQPAALVGGLGLSGNSANPPNSVVASPWEPVRSTTLGSKSRFCGAAGGMRNSSVQMHVTVDDATSCAKLVVTESAKDAPRTGTLLIETGGEVSIPVGSADKFAGMSLKVKTKQEGDMVDVIDVTPTKPAFARPVQWDVLKCFAIGMDPPRGVPPTVTALPEEGKMEQSGGKEEKDITKVVEELHRKQWELKQLESNTLEPQMRGLLCKVIQERREYEESDFATNKATEKALVDAHEKSLADRRKFEEAYQKQLEEDMDAVCEICNDGEVTPDNQILFCEACDVAIHQLCYGIESVPAGDYYCLACRHFNRQKVNSAVERQMRYQAAAAAAAAGETDLATIVQQTSTAQPLPICCELCPVRSGAFVPADSSKKRAKKDSNKADSPDESKWVHMVCAKWQGLNFVESVKPNLLVEDVGDMKINFRLHGIKCCLCLGERGAYNKCRVEGCKNWLHILCARFSGMCDVVHGENARGNIEENPWTLLCPDHSNIPFPTDPATKQKCFTPVHKLVLMSQSFPPEPKLDPRVIYANFRPDKAFNKLTGKERKQAFANSRYEQEVIEEISKKLFGVRCEVCDQWEEDGKSLTRCHCCGVVFCDSCVVEGDNVDVTRRSKYRCAKCCFLQEQRKLKREGKLAAEIVEPSCDVCCQKGGWLRRANAEPVSKKVWNGRAKLLARSLFGRQLWCHSLCSLWCAPTKLDINAAIGCVDMSQVVLSNGNGFIKPKDVCYLCGNTKGLKEPCVEEDCCVGDEGNKPFFHPSCARQAGLEVKDDPSMPTLFYVKCYNHGGNDFNLRARLEDLIEIEVKRAGKGFTNQSAPMTFSDAARLLNASILAMRILGWAWRWSEWWVEHNSNWEPLLEPGQNEKKMTKEQLKIVESTRESRREDARRCRLAAFGAALRNRAYDVEDDDFNGGFDNESLERALKAVLNTSSLVGPLTKIEIKFYVEWLGRAYRSRSRLLGFGDHKIEIGSGKLCRHQKDDTPKFELGDRSIPGGKVLAGNHIFEKLAEPEVDDFDVYREHFAKAAAEQIARAATQQPRKKALKKKKAKRGRPARKIEPAEEKEESNPMPSEPTDIGRQAAIEDEKMPEVAVKKKPGRPKKKRPLPDPDPREDLDLETQADEQPKKRQRRQRLAVPPSPSSVNPSILADPVADPGVIGSPSVLFDRVKKRARSKPQLFGAEDDKKKSGRANLPRRRTTGQGESNEEDPLDQVLDVPILTLLASERDNSPNCETPQREDQKSLGANKSSDGEIKECNDENVGFAGNKVEDKPPVPSQEQDSVAVKEEERVATTDQEPSSKGAKDREESTEVAIKTEISDSAATQDTSLAEQETTDKTSSECAEDRMSSLEAFSASAATSRERGRLTGKWLAIEDFFKTPRSFRGHCDFPPPAASVSTSGLHPVQVMVKTMQYGTKSITVNPKDTVGDIKLRLCPLIGWKVEDVDAFKLKSEGSVHPSSMVVSDLPSTDLAMDVLGRGGNGSFIPGGLI